MYIVSLPSQYFLSSNRCLEIYIFHTKLIFKSNGTPLLTSGCGEYHGLNKSIVPHIKESEKDHNYVENQTHIKANKIWPRSHKS